MRDSEAMSSASDDDLPHVIIVCVRAHRFCDGYLSEAYEEGLLIRIVVRAEELLRGLAAVFDSDLPDQRDVVS